MVKQIYILQNNFTNLKTRKIGKTGNDPEFLMSDLRKFATKVNCDDFSIWWEKPQENIDHRSKTKSCVYMVTGSQQFHASSWRPAHIEEQSWTISPASWDLSFDNFNNNTLAC